MTSTPDSHDPLRNEALEELKKQNIDDLIAPDEIVFQNISDPEPTDSIGEEDWSDDEPGTPAGA
jgi:hypothetical protein